MVVYTWQYVLSRVEGKYASLLCDRTDLYKKGRLAIREEEKVIELAFIKKFVKHWDVEFLKRIDCYVNGGN